MSSTHIQ